MLCLVTWNHFSYCKAASAATIAASWALTQVEKNAIPSQSIFAVVILISEKSTTSR